MSIDSDRSAKMIEALNKANELLVEAEERTRMMLDANPLICNLWSIDGKVFDCNEAALKLFDIKDKKEYMDRFIELAPEFQPDGQRTSDKARKLLDETFKKGKCIFEWMNQKPDGTLIPMEVTLTCVAYKNEYVAVGYGRDLREYNRMLQEINDNMEASRKAAKAKSEFLSSMSHEMRTPMNAIIGMTTIGKNAKDIDGKNHALNKIGDASSHLLGVINDILDMAKIEANKLELAPVEYNFEHMLQKVITVISFRADEKRQRLTLSVDDSIPQFVEGDGQRLAQVITNLLSNAVKFTPEEGDIHVDAALIGETEEDCELRIEVADSGIGISPRQQEKLFRAFVQAESGTSREYGGTGLGLVISKRIIELMDGRIWIESELGKGARFIFTVKVQRSQKSPRSLLAPGVNWKNVRVMIVDDMAETRDQFQGVFSQLGITCDVASDGFEACQIIEEHGIYDLYFIDLRMPGMNGIELTRWVKSHGEGTPSVVTMITATEWTEVQDEAIGAGVDKYLLKPLFSSMIIDCVNECLGIVEGGNMDRAMIAGEFEGKRMLLAEDVEINREILMSLLEDTGFIIECAENGQEALDKVEAAEVKYDVIFMDIQMPKMNGLEATRHIRDCSGYEKGKLPIIAMTANVFKDDVEACLAAGMDAHLGKPLDIDKVLETLRTYLR